MLLKQRLAKVKRLPALGSREGQQVQNLGFTLIILS